MDNRKIEFDWFNAILQNDIKSLEFWVSQKKDINTSDYDDYTPLSWSCFLDRKEITSLLLENGANPFIVDKNGMFPWFISMCKNNLDDWQLWPSKYKIFENNNNNSYIISLLSKIMKYLIMHERWDALEVIFDYVSPNKIGGLYYWIESQSNNEYIPLSHLGYSLNKKDFITLLFKYDYNLDNSDYDNNSVLDIAFCDNNKEWIKYLFNMGAKKYKKNLYQ